MFFNLFICTYLLNFVAKLLNASWLATMQSLQFVCCYE